MKKILTVIMLVVLMVIGGQKIGAAENTGIYLSPPYTDISVDVSRMENFFYLTVGNNSSVEESFNISVVDFGSLDETGGVAFLTVDPDKSERKYALASWISLEKDVVTIASGKSEKIKVTILNKETLAPGGHYGAVLATLKSEPGNKQDKVGVNQSLASLIYVQKIGGEIQDLKFKRMEFSKNIFNFPKTVKLRFGNNGNVHVVPRGTVEIKNGTGVIVAKGIINGDSGKILPESFRILELSINRVKKWSWPGIYSLEINYRYDGLESVEKVETKIIYVGYEGTVIVFGLSVITATVVTLILRQKKRKVR